MRKVKISVFLFFLIVSNFVFADELRLHFLRSPLGINWKSPWSLAISALKNQLGLLSKNRAYTISHVFVELKCDSQNIHIWRGMTSANNSEELDLLFKKKYGLGVVFHTYAGKLEKEDTILGDLAPYLGSKRYGELSIIVSPEACERMVNYVNEYEELGYGNFYAGLQRDPLKREGAGCSAFGVSFMRVAGLMDSFTEEWKRIIDVPKRFIGGPLTNNRISFSKILLHPLAKWSNKEAHIHLEAWDPELMLKWVKKIYNQVQEGTYSGPWPVEVSREKNSYKVKFDMESREVPQGPFWI